MRVLYVAELVSKAGIWAFKKGLPALKAEFQPDIVIAGGNGATGGNGLGRNHASYLRKLGATVISVGDCAFYKKDFVEDIDSLRWVVRPYNLNREAPGRGYGYFKTHAGDTLAFGVILGQALFTRIHAWSPVEAALALTAKLKESTPYVILECHAQATAEKETLFAALDGQVSAVIGAHTRVQTADPHIMPGGSAVITDAGRTGALNAPGGTETASVVHQYLTGIPDWTRDASGPCSIQGVVLDLSPDGKATSITSFKRDTPDFTL
jgi:metallophosphoesterase (TIGR00282 family)